MAVRGQALGTWRLVGGLAAAVLACGGGEGVHPCNVLCVALRPPLTLRVTDATSSAPVDGVTLTNLALPTPPPGQTAFATCSAGPGATICVVDAGTAGVYELDVTAPAHAATHVRVNVPAHAHVDGACCETPWEPQTVEVRLTAP
jgi:hypothetical protein